MKIVMVSHYFGSHRGGIEIVAEELFRQLATRGQSVVWLASNVTPPPEPLAHSLPVPLHALNFIEDKIGVPLPIPTPRGISTIRRELKNADVLIVHDCLYLSNILAFLSARLRRVPVIIVQHLGLVPYSSHFLNVAVKFADRVITRPLLSSAEQVVFISEITKNFFDDLHYKHPPETVFNGLDAELYCAPDLYGHSLMPRDLYGLPRDKPVILFVGRFVEKKGIPALKHMAELKPEWLWVFAGWGPLDPRSWNAENVRVYADLQGPSLAALYGASDVLVLPSFGEGFPLVIQEALASGLGVVCGTETLDADPAMKVFVRGAPVYRNDNDRTAREFVNAIEEFLDSGGNSADQSERRRAFAVSRYSWERAVDRYLEIASRLVSQSVPPKAVAR